MQRAPAPGSATPDASGGSRARARGGIGTPLPSLPPTARLGGDAPLLGDRRSTGTRPDAGRAPGHRPATAPGSGPAVPAHAPAPPGTPAAMPVRSAATASTAAAAASTSSPGTAAVQRATTSAAPPPPVRVRPIARDRAPAQSTSRATPSPSPSPSLSPTVQRSRALLPSRGLTVNTGSAEGFSAPPTTTAAGGSTARPVVAATWRRDVPQAGPADGGAGSLPSTRQPAPSGAAPGDPVQRSATTAATTNPAHRRGGPTEPGRAPQATATAAASATSTTTAPARGVLQRLVRRSGRVTTPSPPAVPPGAPPHRAPQPGPAQHASPAVPPVQRAATAPAVPAAPLPYAQPGIPSASPGASASVTAPGPRRVPVVRPHPPAAARPEAAVPVPVQRQAMPVVPESAGPPAAGPAPVAGAAPGAPPGLSVRVPPRTPAQAAGAGRPESRAQAVQRAAANAGITGVPVQAAPAKPAVQRAGPAAGAEDASNAPSANRLSGTEIEELARRLLDPVSRLIRADLRRGRERSGRLHDGRR
ncbi:hypothetical protein ACIQPT_28990 [Streptomyces sp. NPDC091289]|uniref:hypothetical protein n=1 Tax=Streptomyces sp. NPDC091289 TaxID=3365989 RepID=UPI00381D008A